LPDLNLFDQRLDEELPLALAEAGEVGDEILELVRDRLRVIGLFLQVTDLVFDCSLRLLKLGLFLGGKPLIGDSPGGYHFYTRATLASVYETCGMKEAADSSGAELNYDTGPSTFPGWKAKSSRW
jgi:hypothetical protein